MLTQYQPALSQKKLRFQELEMEDQRRHLRKAGSGSEFADTFEGSEDSAELGIYINFIKENEVRMLAKCNKKNQEEKETLTFGS